MKNYTKMVLVNRKVGPYTILIPLYISIPLEVLEPIQEILVDIPIQNVIPRNNLQLLDAPPQLVQGLVPIPSRATTMEQRDRCGW